MSKKYNYHWIIYLKYSIKQLLLKLSSMYNVLGRTLSFSSSYSIAWTSESMKFYKQLEIAYWNNIHYISNIKAKILCIFKKFLSIWNQWKIWSAYLVMFISTEENIFPSNKEAFSAYTFLVKITTLLDISAEKEKKDRHYSRTLKLSSNNLKYFLKRGFTFIMLS